MKLPAILVCAAIAVSLPAAASAQVQLPLRVGDFVLRDTVRYPQEALGARFAYYDAAGHAMSVFVYPVPPERRTLADSLQLEAEGETFKQTLDAAVRQGLYQQATVVASSPRRFQSSADSIPGYLAVATVRREGQTLVSFMHVVLQGTSYVKTRLTLPADEWRESMVPNAPLDLFRALPARADP
jgi:hypothetical protein